MKPPMCITNQLPIISMVANLIRLIDTTMIASPGPNQLERETPDAIKMFSGLPYVVAARDVNRDPFFKCLTATRTNFDAEEPSATYLWSLNAAQSGEKEYIPFHFTATDRPDILNLVVDSDTSHPDLARFQYTDYASCGVMETHYFGYQCTLWVSDETKDSISQECLQQYADICGESVSLYDKEMCANGELQ
ncbi:uncharacterized protein LOC142584219 [Dermacentor variabilis]|uniref:uncharacterized protein LOC142584219 n=1 Tax=Dermacentor variabilis TaxID=34621 RepID=UPI003F5C6C46